MLVIGIAGCRIEQSERSWLQHPAVSGVILFSRNFASRDQVTDLVAQIRDVAKRPIVICVDQEGGPVQRFRDGFTPLPALCRFGEAYDLDPQAALHEAHEHAWLMASEIRALDIDLSFAPVVDLGRGNRAIGTRAFHAEPKLVAEFTQAYVAGMHEAGMAATVKHFPGHGSVLEDTHFDDAVDPRALAIIEKEDLLPFAAGIQAGAEAVMMAHVCYPAIDKDPAGYSQFWIREVLRNRMGFKGVVFSDDIGMAAAKSAGGVEARLYAHLDSGCDAVLVCAPELVEESLIAMDRAPQFSVQSLDSLMGKSPLSWDVMVADERYQRLHKHFLAARPVTGIA